MADNKDINNMEDIKSEELPEGMQADNWEKTASEQAAEDICTKESGGADDSRCQAENGNDETATEDANQEADVDQGTDSEDKKLFKKKPKTDKKQEAFKQKVDELEDRVKRQMAEFDNYRKRTEKEKTAMFETGAKSVIEKILPVVDNFERGLATIPEEEKGGGFADGMQMIYKQLMTELDNLGVKPIEAVGEEFDPIYHNAVMQVESEEYESGVIAQELQKGYMYRDTVVRHSMVAVVS